MDDSSKVNSPFTKLAAVTYLDDPTGYGGVAEVSNDKGNDRAGGNDDESLRHDAGRRDRVSVSDGKGTARRFKKLTYAKQDVKTTSWRQKRKEQSNSEVDVHGISQSLLLDGDNPHLLMMAARSVWLGVARIDEIEQEVNMEEEVRWKRVEEEQRRKDGLFKASTEAKDSFSQRLRYELQGWKTSLDCQASRAQHSPPNCPYAETRCGSRCGDLPGPRTAAEDGNPHHVGRV
ncbi:MFS general substrate transporter [Zalerion maritima]|uniref:MFS general substrate transporter n=1 Tax=Zalerion maritima TaxID=339359 RepID=A0AAD5RK26_9PEZI|nr:MFS general substrate transporter [Zalerion maritima]